MTYKEMHNTVTTLGSAVFAAGEVSGCEFLDDYRDGYFRAETNGRGAIAIVWAPTLQIANDLAGFLERDA